MNKTTPIEIAKFFQESIDFDLKNQTITSYKQIKDANDEFYTLTDREAFNALLNDIFYFDNQLKDIFSDLYDSELGIQCFANIEARKYPRMRITYFLSQAKYHYHKNNIAKIYFAINTWLAFFNTPTIEPEWEKCPFCQSIVRKGICTGLYCKKTKEEAMKASIELSGLLVEAKLGGTIVTPSYWYNIEEGSEFYNDYKAPILLYTKKQREQEEETKQNTINEGIKEINKVRAMLKIEVDKEKPNFNQLLTILSDSEAIKDANAYNDRSFSQRLNLLTKQIIKKQEELKEQIELKKKYGSFNQTIDDFLTSCTKLKRELTLKKSSLETFKELLDETNKTYENIMVGIKKGYQVKKQSVFEVIKDFETNIQVKATEYIVEKIEQGASEDAKNELVATINQILIDLDKATPIDNKSEFIEKTYIEKVVENTHFDTLRVKDTSYYNNLVEPVRKKIATLVEEENKLKLQTFKKEYESLLNEINQTNKKDSKVKHLLDQLTIMTHNDYYKSIKRNNEYGRLLAILTKKIDNLLAIDQTKKIEQENKQLLKNIEQIQKEKKAIIITSISIISVLIVIIILLLIF